jgi:hypothetical protein
MPEYPDVPVEVRSFQVVESKVLHMVKDGTNYDMVAIRFRGSLAFGNAAMNNGWPVINSIGNRAYLFENERSSVFDGAYLGEKFGSSRQPSEVDLKNFMMMLQAVVSPKTCEDLGREKLNTIDLKPVRLY